MPFSFPHSPNHDSKAGVATPATTKVMASLPSELIEQICSLLCFHCQHKGAFPTAESSDARVSKTTLSHLCRVSRRICVVAQPFLFHYYTTDNLPRHHCSTRAHVDEIPRENDKLPEFLRSIINRPDLASQVKTLQLVETDEISGCTPDLAQLLGKTTKTLGAAKHAPTQEYLQAKIWQGFSGQPQTLMRIQRRKIHHWLEELAVLLSPSLERLFIARDSFVHYEHIKDSGASFPKLKMIAIRGVSKNQHVHEASVLFRAAPNLEILYSLQCSLFDGLGPWTMAKPWILKLQSVRRLVLNDIGLEDLELLVNCCPSLQQLEVLATKIHLTSGVSYWNVAKLLQALQPVRHKLRKLRLSCSPTQKHAEDSRLSVNEISWSFRQFDQLEELSFDQTAIESLSRTTSIEDNTASDWSLIEMFPPSVRKVQILQVRKGFMKTLRRFSEDVYFALPYLRVVYVNLAEGTDKRDVGSNSIDCIESAFVSAGIQLHWATSSPEEHALEMIPDVATEWKIELLPSIESRILGTSRLAVQQMG
ncbi:hypothetical protein LZ30DRAFT_732366 [Colletotrichum cereale]|nr:hypothetical protein LZ30DRAFT_732366 [Colletotrichum cereale]